MSILNHPAINQAYFASQRRRCEEAIEIDVGNAVLRCYHYCPHPELPTLVHFHGNGEAIAHYVRGEYPQFFSDELGGMNVLMMEYRNYGGSSGSVELVSMLADGQAALKQLAIDPAQTIVYGRSIGSLYALELAHRCPTVPGLVIDSGIASIRERFLSRPQVRSVLDGLDMHEVDAEISKHFDHQKKISGYNGRLLILHTQHDGLIERSHADRLFDWASTTHKELRVYAQGDHNTIFQLNYRDMLFSMRQLAQAAFANSPWRPFNGKSSSQQLPPAVMVRK